MKSLTVTASWIPISKCQMISYECHTYDIIDTPARTPIKTIIDDRSKYLKEKYTIVDL